MKSKLLTKKSLIAVFIVICILIGLSYVANKTVVADRLKEMANREKIASTADGLFLVNYRQVDGQGEKFVKLYHFIGNDYLLENADIPAYYDGFRIKTLNEYCFDKSPEVKKVTIPQTVNTIERYSFSECKKLKEIYVPSSVTKIDKTAFKGTKDFTMYVEKNSYAQKFAKENNINIEYYTPKPLNKDKEKSYTKTVTEKKYKDFFYDTYYYNDIPCCVITGYNKMSRASNVDIPKEINGITVTSISPEAFLYCENIKTVTIPNTVTGVGDNSFRVCSSLKKVVFNSGDIKIGEDAFFDAPDTIIYSKKDSNVQKYADKNNIEFKEMN